MGLFRHHVRHGSWLAFVALAINLALSFGHIHFDTARGEQATPGVLLSALVGDDGAQKSKHDGHPDDLCPICMARAAMGNGIAPTPPVLVVVFADVPVVRTTELFLAIPQPPRAAFHSRGPPLS